ncbi:translation initiation factor IF-3 [Alkalilimnicola sp. S0819]|uniref:translation initiation factor IF-3 n=1 Tax=Alkalilimnicola sp. S0819 TaxID=2613922 RepID=UPI0012621155|nr:translation initiation factor IF-3 [Alkalilimnicola sp. S0819]KAB7623646.1 translation initiation factor IF-3 [Alkalilimnicola sp. S0819]MPQ16770.1 translation initiation factor IF-3 [Alkalilimnicola sp. S0819]
MRPRRGPRNAPPQQDSRRINGRIQEPEVRLIDEEGQQVGVVPTEDAMERAETVGMDLVEIDANAKPPVCRIMDYGKYKFDLSKKQQAARKKQKQIQVKEVKFRPGTDEGDYQIKLRNLRRFIEDGDKGKVTLRFRGREMAHQEIGLKLLNRVESDLEDIAQVDSRPRMEGRLMVMMLSPKKGK